MTQDSLLRSVTKGAVAGRFRRLARGDARLTRYAFTYQSSTSAPSDIRPIRLEFDVIPYSSPPTNVHVLIGRNGVGKTHTLTRMLHVLVTADGGSDAGRLIPAEANEDPGLFGSVVSVSFSAFDPFGDLPLPQTPDPDNRVTSAGRRVSYVGLKRPDGEETGWSKTPKDLAALNREFVESARECYRG